jgi:hypothetical protein
VHNSDVVRSAESFSVIKKMPPVLKAEKLTERYRKMQIANA